MTAKGHLAQALYLYVAMTNQAQFRNDSAMLNARMSLWRNIVNRRMYLHAGVGSAHLGERFSFDYHLPNDLAYAETCASIALIFFEDRLTRIERNSEYAVFRLLPAPLRLFSLTFFRALFFPGFNIFFRLL